MSRDHTIDSTVHELERDASRTSARTGASPLMLAWKLDRARVLVVGGGVVARDRVRTLLATDARATIHVVAIRAHTELEMRAQDGDIAVALRAFEDRDIDGARLVFVAIDDPEESRRIAGLCRAAGVPVNVADVPPLCDFYMPAVHRQGPLTIAVSTGGKGPALAARARDLIARNLPAVLGPAIERFGALRQAVRRADPAPGSSQRRMSWLKHVAVTRSLGRLASMDDADIDHEVERYQDQARAAQAGLSGPALVTRPRSPGRVYLVGAGPGDPDLLTVAARRALEDADLVLSDRLVPEAIRALAQGEVRIADKRRGRADQGQDQLTRWMLDAVREGRDVVRLKAGDPGLFGRVLEEIEVLEAEGIAFEVIPGITSALAASLALGLPSTARGIAQRLVVSTGQGRAGSVPSMPEYQDDTTYLWLMAVSRLESLSKRLRARGFPADLPAALIERATQPGERHVVTTLGGLAEAARQHGIRAPAVVMLGHIVAHARQSAARAALPAFAG